MYKLKKLKPNKENSHYNLFDIDSPFISIIYKMRLLRLYSHENISFSNKYLLYIYIKLFFFLMHVIIWNEMTNLEILSN